MNKTPHQIFAECFDENIQPVAHELSEKLCDGHICIDLGKLIESKKDAELEKLKNSRFLVSVDDIDNYEPQPFVLCNDKLYIHRYFGYETAILRKIQSLLKLSRAERETRLSKLRENKSLLQDLFKKADSDKSKDNWQFVGAISAYLNNFSIITGGPGTGKTSTVSKLLSLLFNSQHDLRVAIAAPTGKAAARINDTLKDFKNENVPEYVCQKIHDIQARSIHRLMGGFKKFNHDENRPLPYDIIIVDESSMIDAALMAKLLCAVPDTSRLIMLGDRNQLSSVEAGSIFGDLCHTRTSAKNSFSEEHVLAVNEFLEFNKLNSDCYCDDINILTDCITELEFSHRFNNFEGIGKFSTEVINGISDNLDEYRKDIDADEFLKILKPSELDLSNGNNDFTRLLDEYKAYMREDDILKALDLFNNARVICAVREGKSGVKMLNSYIEKYLGITKGVSEFYNYQPVLVTTNNNELGIFNGDIGIIREDATGMKKAYFNVDQKLKVVPLMYITDYETAFAMTIHKSQGSEYKNVAVVLPHRQSNRLLSRELLYTAVTRAKMKCFVYAEDEILKATIHRKVNRISGITKRITDLNR